MNNNLQIFLYLLMRDHLPTGQVCRIIRDIEKIKDNVTFTNAPLAEMAKQYSERIINSEVL